MANKAGKKALALLIAVLTVGQSFALTGFADSSTTTPSSAVSSENTASVNVTKLDSGYSISLDSDDPLSLYTQPADQSVRSSINSGINPDAAKLTEGYSIDSPTFDLRNVNGKSYVTPVRSQSPFGTCWSFASVAAIESSILGAGLKGADGNTADPKTLNLSEKQIAWFSAMALDDPTNPQNGEGQFIADFMKTPGGLTNFMNRGGNAMISTSTLSQGIGPSHESSNKELEYHGKEAIVMSKWSDDGVKKYSYSESDDWAISKELRFNSDYSIKETHMLPSSCEIDKYGYYHYHEEGTKAIKQELLNLRAVETSFCADTSRPGQTTDAQFISRNWAHYTYIPTIANHAVTIVGWDDNYPKENFIEGSFEMQMKDGKDVTISKQPPENGAWLVKNSWGSEENEFPDEGTGNWGIEVDGKNTGYFWLSYYDKTLGESISYVVEEKDPEINNTDQYDYMPRMSPDACKFDDKITMANKFVAKKDEILRQVSCFTDKENTEVTYEIYLLDDYSDKPTEGIKVATKTVKYSYAGFHKEDLSGFNILFDVSGDGSNAIRISAAQGYSILVTQKNTDGKYLMNFPNANYSSSGGLDSFKGIINSEESYVLLDGEWLDYSGMDDFRKEHLKEFLIGDFDIDTIERSYDNFPIKGYTQTLDTSTGFEVAGKSSIYYRTDSQSSANLRIIVHAKEESIPVIKASDVTWGLLPYDDSDDKIYFDGKAGSDPLSYIVTAKEGNENYSRAFVTIKGIGTICTKLVVNKIAIQTIEFPTDGRTGEMIDVYPYTGEPLTPCIGVATMAKDPLIEGEDYKFVYENNTKCGLATVIAQALSDRVVHDHEDFSKSGFVIVPPKPTIETAKAESSRLTVTVKDQSETGLSGYRLQYREKGETEWKEAFSKGTGTKICAYDFEGGKEYELQVSGYTEIPSDTEWYKDMINYGEASEIATIAVPQIEDPITRISGSSRFATAANIAYETFRSAETVVLAYGYNYVDALAGVPLAAAINAPILLSDKNTVPAETVQAIKTLGAKKVIILGGRGVISETAEAALKDLDLSVERISGSSRYDTAVKIAEKLSETSGDPTDVFFVSSDKYADALSVSSVAAAKHAPIIYLPKTGSIDEATSAYLDSLNGSLTNAYVIGGSGVISDEVMHAAGKALGFLDVELDPDVTYLDPVDPEELKSRFVRIKGSSKYETCVEVNKKFADVLTGSSICVATGEDFPDALAGGVFAALSKSPMILVNGKTSPLTLSETQKDLLKTRAAQRIYVFGGKSAVSDDHVQTIAKAGKAE